MRPILLLILSLDLGLLLHWRVKDLRDDEVEHTIAIVGLLLHLAVDARHCALLDLAKPLDLEDGLFKEEFEDVLAVYVDDVYDRDVVNGVLFGFGVGALL